MVLLQYKYEKFHYICLVCAYKCVGKIQLFQIKCVFQLIYAFVTITTFYA